MHVVWKPLHVPVYFLCNDVHLTQSPEALSIYHPGTSKSKGFEHVWFLRACCVNHCMCQCIFWVMIFSWLIHAALCKSGACDVALCGYPTIALVCGAGQVVARLAGCVVFLLWWCFLQSCEGTLDNKVPYLMGTIWSKIPYDKVARWDSYGTIG